MSFTERTKEPQKKRKNVATIKTCCDGTTKFAERADIYCTVSQMDVHSVITIVNKNVTVSLCTLT